MQPARRRGRFQTCPTNQTIHTPIMGVHSSTATPNPLHRRNPPDVGAGFKPALPTKQPHPHHGGTLIPRNTQPSPSTQSARRRGRFQTCPANQTTTPPSSGYTHPPQTFPLSRWTGEGWGEGPGRRGAHQPNNHPLTAATPSPTTIIPSPSSQPVGAGFKPALPTKHHQPPFRHSITAHKRNQRNQRFRPPLPLDGEAT